MDALVERFALKRVDAIFCTINGIEMDALIGASKTLARAGTLGYVSTPRGFTSKLTKSSPIRE